MVPTGCYKITAKNTITITGSFATKHISYMYTYKLRRNRDFDMLQLYWEAITPRETFRCYILRQTGDMDRPIWDIHNIKISRLLLSI